MEKFDFKKVNSNENIVEDFDAFELCEKAEKIIQEKNKLGFGMSADVFLEDFKSGNLAYKIIHTKFTSYQNPVDTEAQYLKKVKNMSIGEVLIPTPYAVINYKNNQEKYYKAKNIEVLIMEQVDGFTVEDACCNPSLIEDLDIAKFYDTLKTFIKKMNDENIYHRDLHWKNVMIDKDTHKPIIIDFGLATMSYGDDNPYMQEAYEKGPSGLSQKVVHNLISDDTRALKIMSQLLDAKKTLQISKNSV
jgi:serine/threonine protein kinase